jgi:hypothetical protein
MSQLVGLKRFNLRKALSLRLRPRLPPRAGVQVAFSCVGPRLEGVFERFGLLESLREDQQTGNAGKGWEGLGIVPPGPWSALSTHCYHNGSTVSPKAKWFRLEFFRCQILSNEDSQWQLQAVKHGACKNSSFQEWCFTTVHEAVLHCASTWALFVSLFYYIVFLKDKALIRIPRSIIIHMQMMRHGTPVAPFLFSFCAQIGSLHRLAILVRICPH